MAIDRQAAKHKQTYGQTLREDRDRQPDINTDRWPDVDRQEDLQTAKLKETYGQTAKHKQTYDRTLRKVTDRQTDS